MARPKKQINRRADILNTAQKLYTEKGFEKTTIDEIAKSVGISKGSVYLDFKNKEDILISIIEQQVNMLQKRLELDILNAKPPYIDELKEALKQDVSTIFDMATSQVHTHVALIHTSYQIRTRLDSTIQRCFELIAILMKKAETNHEIKPFNDYKKLARLINISLQGFFPPYDIKYSLDHRTDLTKEEIRSLLIEDASLVINILMAGLKTIDYNNN
ncbi:MAG: TetR/AcrR family transcriptional regulator [bacterium]